jgi:hypothetical protein
MFATRFESSNNANGPGNARHSFLHCAAVGRGSCRQKVENPKLRGATLLYGVELESKERKGPKGSARRVNCGRSAESKDVGSQKALIRITRILKARGG